METDKSKQASNDEHVPSKCNKFLFDQKQNDTNRAFKDGRIHEALTILKELKDEYGNDEHVMHLVAKTVFRAIRNNIKHTDREMVDYVVNCANREFFDGIICSFAAGTLYMLGKSVDEKDLEHISRRMSKMNPGLFKKILNSLPDSVEHNDLRKKFIEIMQ